MAVGDRQRLITEIVAGVLGEPARSGLTFPWFKNKHTEADFGRHYLLISTIFQALKGDLQANRNKATRPLKCDVYFGGNHNCMFEFDEFQHFSTPRLQALQLYPSDLCTTFDIGQYTRDCKAHREEADRYRSNKRTRDFDFKGGRTAQRAYFDCFRDLLPEIHGLNPTLRIAECEVQSVYVDDVESRSVVRDLIEQKLSRVGSVRAS